MDRLIDRCIDRCIDVSIDKLVGGSVEGRESYRECAYEIENGYCIIIGGRSTPFEISSCSVDLVYGAQSECKRKR